MKTINMPGFTAETPLYKRSGRYQPVTKLSYSSGGQAVVSQMRAGGLGEAGDPFSGSCLCSPWVCCCEFCYFNNCVFWCWSPIRLG
jgi:hypothetical protein